MLDGAADRRRVTSNLATHLVQLPALLASRVRAGTAGAVPDIGVASHHPHHLIAAGPDPDRRMRFLDRFGSGDGVFEVVVTTFKGGALVCPERDHRVQRLTKAPDSMVEALDSIHLVFGLRPGGADAELQPSAGKVIDRHRHLGQHHRVAIGVAGHHATESDASSRRRDRRQQRPAFIDRPLRAIGTDRCEVVEIPDMIETAFVGDPPDIPKRLDGGRLAGVLEPESKRRHNELA